MPSVGKKSKSKKSFLFWIKCILALIAIMSFILAFFLKEIEQMIDNHPFNMRKGDCLDQFYQSKPPYLNKESLQKNSYPLCFDDFALMFSGVSKTALWAAQALTPKKIENIKGNQNLINHHPNVEQRGTIPNRMMPNLAHYAHSNYIQANLVSHLTNNTKKSTVEYSLSFTSIPLVSNSVLKNLNDTENLVRQSVTFQNSNAFVITGPIYSSQKLRVVGQDILVPTALFKAVYFPQEGIIGAYYIPNAYSQKIAVVSVCQIEEMTGINIFPQLTEEQKRNTYRFPLNEDHLIKHQKIEYSYWDAESQCAESISSKDMQRLKNRFKFDLN